MTLPPDHQQPMGSNPNQLINAPSQSRPPSSVDPSHQVISTTSTTLSQDPSSYGDEESIGLPELPPTECNPIAKKAKTNDDAKDESFYFASVSIKVGVIIRLLSLGGAEFTTLL